MSRDKFNTIKMRGFTVVELLIVIVVVGLLSSITVVAYNGVQRRAVETVIASDLGNNAKLLESYRILNNGYPEYQDTYEWWSEIKSTGMSFSGYSGEYYVGYCVDNESNEADWAILVETLSGGSYYKTASGSSGEINWEKEHLHEFCEDILGFPDQGHENWVKGYDGWAGGEPW